MVWRQATNGAVQSPMIALASPFLSSNTTLFVPVLNTMLAIHPATHEILWSVTHSDQFGYCTTAAFSDFNYYFTAVYFTCGNTLYAANALAGRVDWKFSPPKNEGSLTPPSIDLGSGTVFVGSSKVEGDWGEGGNNNNVNVNILKSRRRK